MNKISHYLARNVGEAELLGVFLNEARPPQLQVQPSRCPSPLAFHVGLYLPEIYCIVGCR